MAKYGEVEICPLCGEAVFPAIESHYIVTDASEQQHYTAHKDCAEAL